MTSRKESDMFYQYKPLTESNLLKLYQDFYSHSDKIEWLKQNKQTLDRYNIKTINVINSWMNKR